MITDKILVERVTDGEKCGECNFLSEVSGDTRCLLFGSIDSWRDESVIWRDGKNALRCVSCLATPSAPALTAEQVDMLLEISSVLEINECFETRELFRAAFPEVFEVEG